VHYLNCAVKSIFAGSFIINSIFYMKAQQTVLMLSYFIVDKYGLKTKICQWQILIPGGNI